MGHRRASGEVRGDDGSRVEDVDLWETCQSRAPYMRVCAVSFLLAEYIALLPRHILRSHTPNLMTTSEIFESICFQHLTLDPSQNRIAKRYTPGLGQRHPLRPSGSKVRPPFHLDRGRFA